MWDALDIGSAPIQVLEPGCGTGNFMTGIPENIKANVSGVELDPISARIAAALNPDATILNADLADCTIHPGFDLTIGNVPYSGDISLDYRTTDGGTSRLPLHDYFIERSVDALRPGGVAMLLTSRYTLDKRSETMRADLARKAELVGAVRLPSARPAPRPSPTCSFCADANGRSTARPTRHGSTPRRSPCPDTRT